MSDREKADTSEKSSTKNEVTDTKIASKDMPAQEATGNPQATAESGDTLVDKLKKRISKAYQTGAKVVDELSQTAQEYAEKHKAESEIRKLKDRKDELMTQLGQSVFKHNRAGGQFTESFFKKEEIADQFIHIDSLDMKIIETGKLLDKAKD